MALTAEQARDLASFRKAALSEARGRLRLSDLAVYRALVDCIHWPDMTAFKSTARIAAETGITERNVRNAKRRLMQKGALLALAYENGGRGKCTVFAFPYVTDKRGKKEQGIVHETRKKTTDKHGKKPPPYNSLSNIKKGAASRRQGDKGQGGEVRRHLEAVEPREVRAMLEGWGYAGKEIDGFSEREVNALLGAEGYKLKA